jgi:hypothetical protein
MLLLLSIFIDFSLSRFCQSAPPTTSLLEELRLCRELNYAFCIEASSSNLLAARDKIDDLPNDVASAAESETSAMAVVADRHLVSRLNYMASSGAPSQTCLHHFRMALCSEMFSLLGVGPSLCFATCRAVKEHCEHNYVTEACSDVLRRGATAAAACVDYTAMVCNDTCTTGDSKPKPFGVNPAQLGGGGGGIVGIKNHAMREMDDDDNDGALIDSGGAATLLCFSTDSIVVFFVTYMVFVALIEE